MTARAIPLYSVERETRCAYDELAINIDSSVCGGECCVGILPGVFAGHLFHGGVDRDSGGSILAFAACGKLSDGAYQTG